MTRLLSEDKVLIAAHRGVAGGNIPCNTLPAFEAALRQGADIIELDVTRSMDGQLFIFHPGKEAVFLRTERSIERMESREVERLPLMNQDQTPTKYHVPRLEEALKLLRGRCLINLDKFWMWPEEITALVRELGMQDQVLIKTNASHCKVHPHAAGAKGGNQDMSRTKGGSTPRFTLPWIRLVCRSELLSQKAPELIARRLYTLCEVLKDSDFYAHNSGGLTISGAVVDTCGLDFYPHDDAGRLIVQMLLVRENHRLSRWRLKLKL